MNTLVYILLMCLRIQLVEQLEQLIVLGNNCHGVTIMGEAGDAGFIYNNLSGHAAKLEKIDLLAIQF